MAALISNYTGGFTPGDPFKQPAFAIWSNSGAEGGFSIIDHNYNCMSRYMINDSNYGMSRFSSTGAPETYEVAKGGTFNTSAATGSTNTYANATYTGYLGHCQFPMGFWPGCSNGAGDVASGYTSRALAFACNGTIVNDIYQDYAIFIDGTSFRVMQRSATNYYLNSANSIPNFITITNKQSGYTGSKYGTISYNANTNKLCVLETNGSYGWRPTVYSNVPKLRSFVNNIRNGAIEQYAAQTANSTELLYSYFSNASNYSTSYVAATGKPRNSSSSDDFYRCIPVMCDNGSIVMFQMIPDASPGAWLTRWDASGANAGSLKTWVASTPYGIAKGNQYGARYVVSSDGRYVLAYCPYYYYGAGSNVALIRVSDGKIVWDSNTDATYSYFYAPIGKSGFVCTNTTNSDGPGIYFKHISSPEIMNTIADNSQASLCSSGFNTGLISNNYYSTDYPGIIPLQYDTSLFSI